MKDTRILYREWVWVCAGLLRCCWNTHKIIDQTIHSESLVYLCENVVVFISVCVLCVWERTKCGEENRYGSKRDRRWNKRRYLAKAQRWILVAWDNEIFWICIRILVFFILRLFYVFCWGMPTAITVGMCFDEALWHFEPPKPNKETGDWKWERDWSRKWYTHMDHFV